MKKMVFALTVILVFGAILLKDPIIKSTVTITASHVVGAPVHIDSFSFGILKHAIRISGLKIYNPKSFPKGVLLDLPKIHVDYNLGNILRKKMHLTKVDIVLKDVVLVKNSKGELNVDSLKIVKKPANDKPTEEIPLLIDSLKLDIGQVVLKDYTAGSNPAVYAYNLKIQRQYENITSAQQLTALILSEPMKAAGIQGAAIYGVSALAGMAILPVAVIATFTSKDSAEYDFSSELEQVYEISRETVQKMGKIVNFNKSQGLITGEVNGAQVTLKVQKKQNKVNLSVSARKYLLPKPEIASGIIYTVLERIK